MLIIDKIKLISAILSIIQLINNHLVVIITLFYKFSKRTNQRKEASEMKVKEPLKCEFVVCDTEKTIGPEEIVRGIFWNQHTATN